MSMIFRLIRVIVYALCRPQVGWLDESSIRFRVWPTDLDVLWHMNNGKYFSIMDLARLDLMIRSGFIQVTRKRGWYPVIASEMIRFKQSLMPFRRFEVRTQLIGWSERYFYLKQVFMYKGDVAATGVVRVRFLSKHGGTVNAHTIVDAIAPGLPSPDLPGYLHNWQHAERDYTELTTE